jgi:hypothetical protein
MADMSADYKVEQLRVVWQIAQQRAEIERYRFAIGEAFGKLERVGVNITAGLADIATNETALKDLPDDASGLDRQKLITALAGQRAKIEDRRLEALQIPVVARKADTAGDASIDAVDRLEATLADLVKTHGAVTDSEYTTMLRILKE